MVLSDPVALGTTINTFLITVNADSAPLFSSIITTPVNVTVGSLTNVLIPTYSDSDSGDTVTLSITFGTFSSTFVTQTGNTLVISPTLGNQIGTY